MKKFLILLALTVLVLPSIVRADLILPRMDGVPVVAKGTLKVDPEDGWWLFWIEGESTVRKEYFLSPSGGSIISQGTTLVYGMVTDSTKVTIYNYVGFPTESSLVLDWLNGHKVWMFAVREEIKNPSPGLPNFRFLEMTIFLEEPPGELPPK